MFCPKCGVQMREGAVFCPKCGNKLNVQDDIPQAEPATAPVKTPAQQEQPPVATQRDNSPQPRTQASPASEPSAPAAAAPSVGVGANAGSDIVVNIALFAAALFATMQPWCTANGVISSGTGLASMLGVGSTISGGYGPSSFMSLASAYSSYARYGYGGDITSTVLMGLEILWVVAMVCLVWSAVGRLLGKRTVRSRRMGGIALAVLCVAFFLITQTKGFRSAFDTNLLMVFLTLACGAAAILIPSSSK